MRNAGTICRGSPVGVLHAKGQWDLAPAIPGSCSRFVTVCANPKSRLPSYTSTGCNPQSPLSKPSRIWAPHDGAPMQGHPPVRLRHAAAPSSKNKCPSQSKFKVPHNRPAKRGNKKGIAGKLVCCCVCPPLQAGRKSEPASSGLRRVRPTPAGGAFLTLMMLHQGSTPFALW